MKPKSNRKAKPGAGLNASEPKSINDCQTPAYALAPLLPFLDTAWRIWEPAAGDGHLVRALANAGFAGIYASDLKTGQSFFEHEPPVPFDAIVTNGPWTPFSLKSRWIWRAVSFNKPTALLVPLETMGAGTLHPLYQEYGAEWLVPDKRIAYGMPQAGFEDSHPQMPSAWLTFGLNIGRPLTYVNIYPEKPILEGYYQMSIFEVLVQHAPDVALAQPQQMELVTA